MKIKLQALCHDLSVLFTRAVNDASMVRATAILCLYSRVIDFLPRSTLTFLMRTMETDFVEDSRFTPRDTGGSGQNEVLLLLTSQVSYEDLGTSCVGRTVTNHGYPIDSSHDFSLTFPSLKTPWGMVWGKTGGCRNTRWISLLQDALNRLSIIKTKTKGVPNKM